MADDMNVTSPSAAFARQARMEARIEHALSMSLRGFLGDVRDLAEAQGNRLGAATVHERWAYFTSAYILEQRLPTAVAEYVSESVAQSTLPDDVFNTVTSVFQAAGDQQWSSAEVSATLAEALAVEGREAFLTAAGTSARSKTRDAARRRAEAARKAAVSARSATARANAAQAEPEPEEPKRPRRRNGADWGALDEGGMSWMDRMKRDARTAVTGLDGMLSTAEMRRRGLPYKMWVTRRDERVRHAHAAADTQTVPTDQPFTVGGVPMMHPGDRSAPASLTVNCRCITVGVDREVRGTTDLPFISP
ncbi:MuF-like minor capsid protein [Microbacterium phage Cressida]|uniref:MuF-like minor capsid protein n=1 Tax=Microbacterium phage Cressida TaxID=2591216 RepID=A0A514DI29_9CAUD|nr:MuF-like minor capsid protein [Microbacterium phage Cressida]QDH93257.1 MuF-like minor capsid protein [Microbacterium phage Cressida]